MLNLSSVGNKIENLKERKGFCVLFTVLKPFGAIFASIQTEQLKRDQKCEKKALTSCTLSALSAKPEQGFICYSSLPVMNQQQK